MKKNKLGKKEESRRDTFTNREVSQHFRIPLTTIKRYHLDLYNNGRIEIVGKKGRTYQYAVTDYEEYTKKKGAIDSVLDEILEGVRKKASKNKKT